MSTNDNQGITRFKMKYDSKNIVEQLTKQISKVMDGKDIQFACIGTDRSSGDCFAPIIGTQLEKLGYDVIGTLKKPLHAVNLHDRLENERNQNKTLVAIDACLGKLENVGNINFGYGSITPGAGVGKDLGKVGDMFITGVINVGGFMEYHVLQNTRLSVVMDMAEVVVESIKEAIPLQNSNNEEDKNNVIKLAFI